MPNISVYLDTKLYDKVREKCKEEECKESKVMQDALKNYLGL